MPLSIICQQLADPELVTQLSRIASALETIAHRDHVDDKDLAVVKETTAQLRRQQDDLQGAVNQAERPTT